MHTLVIASIFLAAVIKASSLNPYVWNCHVPYALQFTMLNFDGGSKRIGGPSIHYVVLRDLSKKELFSEPDEIENDIQIVLTAVKNACTFDKFAAKNAELETILRSSLQVMQLAETNGPPVTLFTELSFKLVIANLESVVSLSHSLSNNRLVTESDVCMQYVESCLGLLNECILTAEEKKELAALLGKLILEKYEVRVGSVDDKVYNLRKQNFVSSSLPRDDLNDPFLNAVKNMIGNLINQRIVGAKMVIRNIMLDFRSLQKFVFNGCEKLTPRNINNHFGLAPLGSTPLYKTLKAYVHPENSAIPPFKQNLLNFFDRLIERFRLLLLLKCYSVSTLKNHPFEMKEKAKEMGIKGDIFEILVKCQTELLRSFEAMLSIHKTMKKTLRVPINRQVKSCRDDLALLTALIGAPVIDIHAVMVSGEYTPAFWMPHAFQLLLKQSIVCPVKAVYVESELRKAFAPVLACVQQGDLTNFPASITIVDNVRSICKSHDINLSENAFHSLQRHLEDVNFLIKRNLSSFAPNSMSAISTPADFIRAKMEFLGVLAAEDVDQKTLSALSASFQADVRCLSVTVGLSNDDEGLFKAAKYWIGEWIAKASFAPQRERPQVVTPPSPAVTPKPSLLVVDPPKWTPSSSKTPIEFLASLLNGTERDAAEEGAQEEEEYIGTVYFNTEYKHKEPIQTSTLFVAPPPPKIPLFVAPPPPKIPLFVAPPIEEDIEEDIEDDIEEDIDEDIEEDIDEEHVATVTYDTDYQEPIPLFVAPPPPKIPLFVAPPPPKIPLFVAPLTASPQIDAKQAEEEDVEEESIGTVYFNTDYKEPIKTSTLFVAPSPPKIPLFVAPSPPKIPLFVAPPPPKIPLFVAPSPSSSQFPTSSLTYGTDQEGQEDEKIEEDFIGTVYYQQEPVQTFDDAPFNTSYLPHHHFDEVEQEDYEENEEEDYEDNEEYEPATLGWNGDGYYYDESVPHDEHFIYYPHTHYPTLPVVAEPDYDSVEDDEDEE